MEWSECEPRLNLGEGPLWHPVWKELLVVDVPSGEIHRFDARLTSKGSLSTGRPTSAVTWQQDGSILCFHDRGEISRIGAAGEAPQVILALPEEADGMFNDVTADPNGRVLCGALPVGDRPGRLYALHPDGSHDLLLDDLLEPNGLAFSPDGRVLYFADSVGQKVWRMDYDPGTGRVDARCPFWQTSGDELPDGVTVDAQGAILCAVWRGGCVVRLSQTGVVERFWNLPARRITSIAFGDRDLDVLYVTSARQDGPEGPGDESAGAVFRLPGCGRGRPEWPSRLAP